MTALEGLQALAEPVGHAEVIDVSRTRFPRRRPPKYDVDDLLYERELLALWDSLPEAARERFEHEHRFAGTGREATEHVRRTPLCTNSC